MQLLCMERKRCPRDEAGPVLGCTSGPGTLCFTMGTLPLASPPVVLTVSLVEGTRRAASCPNRCCPHDYPAMCLHSSNLFLSLPASRGMWPWEKEGQALGEGWVLKSRTVTEMQWRVGIPSSGQVGHHWLLQGTRGKASAPLSPVHIPHSIFPVPPGALWVGGEHWRMGYHCQPGHVPQRDAPLSCSSHWGSSASASRGKPSCGQRSHRSL